MIRGSVRCGRAGLQEAAKGLVTGRHTPHQAAGQAAESAITGILDKIMGKLFDKLENTLISLLPEALKSALGIGQATAETAALTTAITTASTAQVTAAGVTGPAAIVAGLTPLFQELALAMQVPKPLGFSRGGIVPSPAGGWALPSFSGAQLSMLHANEMVLPSDISQGLQSMIRGGGSGISAHDAGGVAKWAKANGAALLAGVNGAMRNGGSLRQQS